ncbi:ABC transporter permease subunit, partial [Treponema sp. OttesenSCG-928-L16]|nr:ABC transporter permease subunit [Treponema sp. OttesenSCG-928-L16]
MKNTSIHKHIRSAASFLAKTFLGFVILIPILVSLSYSLRPDTEIMNMSMSLLPERWTLEHYRWLFRYIPMTRYIINSFICCAIVIVCQTVCASLAAYAFAFFEFPFKKALFTAVLVTTMIPGDVIIITNFLNIQRWNLTDTYLGLVFPFLISGISIFMMRQFYLSLPKELKEAATIDGCG